MPRPTEAQLNKFAEGIARAKTVRQAATEAGYAPTTASMYLWLRRPSFVDRIEKFRRERDQPTCPDLVPIIERLVRAADAAITPHEGKAPSGVALQAARGLLAEAARLKRLLPKDAPAARRPDFEMTRAEWLATFAPKPAGPAETA